VRGVDGLDAMMLDMKRTFDEVIERHAPDRGRARRIKSNRFYQQLSSSLAGTQEYMAMEKLYDLHRTGAYDCIVIDTPPTRHALDFAAHYLAAGKRRKFAVELLVQFGVCLEIHLSGEFAETFVQLHDDVADARQRLGLDTALGCEARGGPLQHATEFDRVHDVGKAEGPHHETTVAGAVEQPFLGQSRHGLAHRRARYLKLFGHRNLEQSHPAREFAAEYLLPQFDDGAYGVSLAGVRFHQDPSLPLACIHDGTRGVEISSRVTGSRAARLLEIEADITVQSRAVVQQIR
jgi:hypothetical protein